MVYYSPSGYNSDMFLTSILSWWYSNGLVSRSKLIKGRIISLIDFFSIDLLITTLFAPFRQISAGDITGPMGVQMRALFDKLISRFVGACVRSFMIIIGSIAILLQSIFGLIVLAFWLIVPLFPVIGLIMWVIGFTTK